jgi:hypothetical protein
MAKAESQKTYGETSVEDVFHASQRAIRKSKHSISEENFNEKYIIAKTGSNAKTFGHKVTIEITENGGAANLKIVASTFQLIDWGEGKKIASKLLSDIDFEIREMKLTS